MNKEKYIKDVLKNISADSKTIKRIKEDLNERIERAEENDPFFDVIIELGHPHDVAKEFNENLELDPTFPVSIGLNYSMSPYEYKSKRTLFGLPLVHINMGGRYRTKRAKGIVAIGDVATGLVAVGGIAVGLISSGGIAIGALALGGVGIGALAIGGVAVGGIAIGAVAIGASAFGAVALGLMKAFGAVTTLFK